MNYFGKPYLLIFLLLFIFCLGQANGQLSNLGKPKFTACLLEPPAKVLFQYKKIAVLDFKSIDDNEPGTGDGAKIADYLTKWLLEEARGKNDDLVHTKGGTTKVFEVMDRSNVIATLKENPQLGDEVDENEAVEIGKILGVDAVIIGNCSYTSKDDLDRYLSKETYYYTRKRTVEAEARINIVDVATGEFVGSSNGKNSQTDSKIETGGYPSEGAVDSEETLANTGYHIIASQLATYLCPRYVTRTYMIKNLNIKKYKQRAKGAREQLQLNNIEPAYQLYEAIFSEDNYNPKAAYNLGVIFEVGGDYNNASKYFDIAHQLDGEDKFYDEALARIKRRIEAVKELESFGIRIIPYTFETGNREELLRAKVKIKGAKKDRTPIFQDSSEHSSVIKRVPGGMEFSVINTQEDWILIDLAIGDETGYVRLKDVKTGQ